MIDPILLSAVHIRTWREQQVKTNATGFFFKRGERLFLVTSRHVMIDEPSQHFPDILEIEFHTDAGNLAAATRYNIPLYDTDGQSTWRQGKDKSGEVDVACVEIDRSSFPHTAAILAFTPEHIPKADAQIDVGSNLLVVGFPLGFHDTLHHMPVVRHAVLSSSFGLRFQGEGFFLTDGRTHRGTSGAPVVVRTNEIPGHPLDFFLLGIHSARLDVGTRDLEVDEALGLNCAWYADILMTLTQ